MSDHASHSDTASPAPRHLRIHGGTELAGSIDVKTSKNAGVALLCASLLNRGPTVLRRIARIEEINRILRVLESIGVHHQWRGQDLEIHPPERLDLTSIDADAARRTRTIIMFLGPLLHDHPEFELPFAGGCQLGDRTVEPHLTALRRFGLSVERSHGCYRASVKEHVEPPGTIVLTERGDTVTANALTAAARFPDVTVIRNASSNYQVQDLCWYLERLGVRIDGIGTTTLTVHGREILDTPVDYAPSEDPIEAWSLVTAAIATESEITVRRTPIEFVEIELALAEEMGLAYSKSPEYLAANGRTRLVDLTVHPSPLHAAADKIHPMPFPGLNIDNLPFFALIGSCAKGSTMIHDWVYENRAIYLTELNRLGAKVRLLDPHRLHVEGPVQWSGAEVLCPPALRPAAVLLLAMLRAQGTSELRHVDVIHRGYEQLAERLQHLGARIEPF
ncbi:UDP-N-acetylglucosamine 1-carboxyvinyltransferase [Glycomyces sp. TRM65418]|uniref:UDP-N-acetylglucosamine 1-carboxyvinyltransferase n=1 Tax=Glycomyces sp. TRM65418 TaxID=2867006 RepID=UPI001CE6229E|nr:UDP-N-acetylglucosamine 1-carboxyvinyltransferase [Glycomyces sp. TRM65418]MCC3763291.1 UDP-N-acetylglucosamine 1-carboxyvinyltransferase [Glycomyces sp. TRM65418]QZD57290.1 UDP-N-acetylglucosamine 1-carboxyvinyltransferase [Glycomyces sp. TRM65418]